MIKLYEDLSNKFNRDNIEEYQRKKFKHTVRDDGKIEIYFPFTWTKNLAGAPGGGTLIDNLKAQYGEYTDDVIGYDNDVIYSGSIGTGIKELVPFMGERPYTMVVIMRLNIHYYNELLKASRIIPFVNSVRNPTMKLVNDMYDGKTLYNEKGIDIHLNNVIQVDWNTLGDIKYELKYMDVNKPVSEKRLKYSKEIKEIGDLYEKS